MSKEIQHQAGLAELSPEQGVASSSGDAGACRWFVMRDLKRANARQPAYKFLSEHSLRVFTPMTWRLCTEGGRRVRREVPFIPDLLFVHASRESLDPIVDKTATLQYRWLRNTWREPMTVADAEMSRFIHAVSTSESRRYYLPEEITPAMQGRRIRIVGGPFDGYEGSLLTVRGSKTRRLLVEIPNLIAVGIEVRPEYIRLL